MLMVVLFVTIEPAVAQKTPYYFVTVNPATPDSPIYTTIGSNWTLSFEALWSYGDASGTPIENATVTIQVNNTKNEVVNTLLLNTTDGSFSFNYSSSTAGIFTFTPTKLVTPDGIKWNSSLLDTGNNVYGFQSKSVVVWWDTFHVSLVDYDTSLGVTTVSVNVTYLLLPEEGLTLPEWATYSHQPFLPKMAHNVNVTINGLTADETSTEGIFEANVSIWLPTAYIIVGVSQEGWVTTNTGFCFAQDTNGTLWGYAVIFASVLVVAVLVSSFVLHRKEGHKFLSLENYPFLGGVLLAIASVISLYWGLVGLDSTLHGFDWWILTILGLGSFSFGLIGGFFSIRKKNQALVIFTIILPMVTNLMGVDYSLGIYELDVPWLILIASFVLIFISAFLICNADDAFR